MDTSLKGEIAEAGAEPATRRIRTLEEKLAIPLLPVKVESPTLLPTVNGSSAPKAGAATGERGVIEVEFPSGIRVRLHGTVEALLLRRVLKTLRR